MASLPIELFGHRVIAKIGTGAASEVTLEVLWPGGKRESFGTVKAGSRVRLVEGAGKVRELPARTRGLVRS